MTKKFIVAILTLFLLNSCISIKQGSAISTSQQNFVTATLVFPASQRTPTAPTLPTYTSTPSPAIIATANCTNAAILLRDVTVPDYTQVMAGETFTKTWEFKIQVLVRGRATR